MAANCRRLATSTSSWRFLRILPPGILLTFGRLGKTWQPPNNSPVHVKQGPSWTFQGAYVVPCLWLSCITSGWVTLSMHGTDNVGRATKYGQSNETMAKEMYCKRRFRCQDYENIYLNRHWQIVSKFSKGLKGCSELQLNPTTSSAVRRPNLLHKHLQVRPKNMSLLYRYKMASVWMLTVGRQITSSGSPSSWN
jgi:hypothetical protein